MDLQRVDLNLMLAFEVLMAERSVSAAATRLGVSQPAMSGTLARLRSLFDDELLVRSGRAMLPTARATELQAPIGQALEQLREALEPRTRFDPAISRRCFCVSGGDYAGTVILPRLAARLRRDAPGVDLRFRFLEKAQTFDLLPAVALDLALGVHPDPPKRFGAGTLFEERFVCVASQGNPALRDGMTLDAFVALPHLLITERGDATGAVDAALRRLGMERRVALTLPYVSVVPSLLPDSDLVATLGARAARRFAATAPLALHDPPVALPAWRMSMLWSRRQTEDLGLAWLRRLLVAIGADS